MVNDASTNAIEAAIQELLERRVTTLEEKTSINEAIVALLRVRDAATAQTVVAIRNASSASSKTIAPPSAESQNATQTFFGMGLREATAKQLTLAGEPQLPNEIWAALSAAGFVSNHNDPPSAVRSALRRRAQVHGDVLLVGGGKWGRKDWYTEAELEEIRKSVGGMGGRDRGAHMELTKAGMAVARARGARIGAKSKLDDEMIEKLRQLRRAGADVRTASKAVGISAATYYNNVARIEPIGDLPTNMAVRPRPRLVQ